MELYAHQKKLVRDGLDILSMNDGLLIAAEPRTGKTLTSLKIAEAIACLNHVIIVTKKNAMIGWKETFEQLNHSLYHIINYESIHKLPQLALDHSRLVIFDECHKTSSFPKPNQCFKRSFSLSQGKKVILLSATPSIESGAQLFHTLRLINGGPFAHYKNFYQWHKDFGERDEQGRAPTRKINGFDVADYSKVKFDEIMDACRHITLSLTEQEANFSCPIHIEKHHPTSQTLSKQIQTLKKSGIINLSNHDRPIVADSTVRFLQVAHMMSGGFANDDKGQPVQVSNTKAQYLKDSFTGKWVVFCNYREEREYLLRYIQNATEDFHKFREMDDGFFIGSIRTWSEGTDFSHAQGLIFYSLSWSGTTWAQAIKRCSRKDRSVSVPVHVLLSSGVDNLIFKAVSEKKDFNTSFYRKAK